MGGGAAQPTYEWAADCGNKDRGTSKSSPAKDCRWTLSAYDDLIENNRRRIALLEKAARLLYREWFVHLRFPGHEHVKITDGLPAGWERRTLGDIAETNKATYQAEGTAR